MKKSFFKIFLFIIALSISCGLFFFLKKPAGRELAFDSEKNITISDDELFFNAKTSAQNISGFLAENKITLGEHDQIIPAPDSPLLPGMNIDIKRALKIKIIADGKTADAYALENSVNGALWENNIKLGEDDFTKPALDAPLQNNSVITVIRVDVHQDLVEKAISFDTVSNEDGSLSWRVKKMTQKGIVGTNEITYKVVSYDGKEISRKILSQNKTKDPTPEIVTQGTFMKLGKSNSGQGTWYSFRGGLFAASTTLPRGSYAKITNTENGQSVVVQINDYGPFGKGRIIDLDKVAFQKIADIGAGVIGVKVEQILN